MHRCILLLMLAFLVAGCSGGTAPVSPGQETASIDGVPVIDLSHAGDTFNAIGLMGAYELIINPDDMTADLITKRGSAIGEGYIVSGISFFTMWPCSNCLQLTGISLDANGNAVLSFDVTHPFPPGNTNADPTAMNRLDLDVFDVAMVMAPQDGTAEAYPLTGVDTYAGIFVDADGYTRELQNVIGDNAALPYYLVIDDSETGTSTWNKLAMGASADFDIKFAPTGAIRFDMYLTMGYGFSARKLQRLTPKYYNPEFNRKAAWKVEVIPPGPAEIGSTWDDNDPTTEFDVEIHVYNWQQGATVYGDPADFENAPADNIYAASDVGSVSVEISGMTNSLPSETTAASGTGMPDDPLVYMIPVANENLLVPGQYHGLVKVTDQRSPGTIGDRDFMIDTPDGIILNNYDLPEYATYQMFIADVILGCGPVTGEILSPSPCPDDLATGQTLNFEVTASSDNDGDPIVLYEIDFDYDGTNFNPSDSNTTGIFNDVGPFTVPDPCEDNIPYDFTVAFRATDSCDPPNETIFAQCTVTVSLCCTGVGDVTVTAVNRGEFGLPGNRVSSLDLEWDYMAGCAEEFVIQQAYNAWGNVTPSWVDIDTVAWPETSYKYRLDTGRASEWDEAMRFRVIAREIAGNPGSAYDPSYEVFAYFVSDAGNQANNRWTLRREHNDFRMTTWSGGSNIDVWPTTSGVAVGMISSGGSTANRWAVAYQPKPIPNLAGAKEAFCDGFWRTIGTEWNTRDISLTIGTVSEPPTDGAATLCDYEPANNVYNSLWAYDRTNCPAQNTEFCLENQDGWKAPMNWRHVGYYLNDLLDDDRNYIAHGWASHTNSNTGFVYGWSDGWAFIVH